MRHLPQADICFCNVAFDGLGLVCGSCAFHAFILECYSRLRVQPPLIEEAWRFILELVSEPLVTGVTVLSASISKNRRIPETHMVGMNQNDEQNSCHRGKYKVS